MAEQQSLFFAQQLLGVMLNHLYCLLNDAVSVQNLQPDNIPDDEQDETDQAMDIVMDYISNVRSYMTTLGQKRQNTVDEDDVPSGMNHSIVSIDQESSSNWPDMDVMGFSPNEKYWSFAQYTNDHALRDCILNYLSKTGEEKEIVTYFCKLQEAYNCASFERVKENLLPLSGWKGLDPVAACMTISASQYDLRSSCGEISPDQQHIPASLNNNRYCDVLLDWLLSWSTDVQQLVLLDAQMTSQSCSVQYPDIPNHVMWEYLVSHNRIDAALNWLSEHIALKKDEDSPDDTLSYQQILHTVKTSATSYLRELIYMQLARNGILDSSVPTGKFGRFLQLLCQLGGVLKIPSPVSHIDNIYIELHHFHQDFIAYCTENRFGYLLWKYCEKNQITPKQLSLQLFDDHHIMWIKMFQNFYSLSLNPYDISPMYEASLANAGVVWNLRESTVAGLVQQGHVLAALATTLYGNDLLTSMTSSLGVPDPFQGIDMDTLEDSLLQFPRLHDALFPTSIKKASQYDITVYQLLRGNSPFDPARLFGWHSTNTVAGEDSLKVMPHFSLPELMSKYAQPEGIQFTYYLRQGRPTFAFCSFVSEEFTHGTVLASHRIQAACWIATKIGVKSFYQPQIAASCSAFIEMLGGNSILLRLLVDVGNKVVTHKNAKLMSWGGGIQWRKDYCKQHEEETGRLLMACFKQRGDCASELLHQLEDAIMLKLEEEDVSPFSFEAGHMWTLSVLLCIQLHLPYPTKYLEICASTNNWLPFLWFAQLHQYPKEQLHQMVSWFPNSHLRDHIFYVLNNAQNRFLAELAMPPTGDDTKRPRSFRSGFYSRLGMSKSLDTTQSSSDEEEDTLSLASFKNENKDTDLEFELKSESAADDVFRVIFSAQATKSVWKSLLAHGIALRNPLFTELAACQKDANILSCLCGWLLSVMDPPRHTQFLNQHSHIVTKWNLDHLRELLEIFLNNNWISNLATGFAIFQMDTPLALFLKFLSCCLEKHNYSECHSLLEQFKHSLLSKPKGERTSVSQMPPSFCMIGDLHWQEHTCQCLVRHLLASLLNIYDILQLLKYLHHCNIASVFTSLPGLNYGQLLKVAQILHENQLSISFHLFLVSDQKLLTSQLEPLVTNIVSKKLYDHARMLCEFAKISHEDVTMKEVVNEKEELQKSHAWLSELVRINFWKECLNKFTEHGVSPMKIVQFYLNEIKKCQNGSSNMNEQAIMYELCVKSLLDAPDPSGNLYANTVNELTHKMWYCRIMARVPKIERIPSLVAPIDEMFVGLEEIPPSHLKTSALKTELLQHGKMPNISQKPSEFSDSEQRALSLLIGELLDEARLSDCCRIAAEFYFYSQDLAIILTCIRLSIGSISVDEIVPEIKQLLSQSADINMNTTTGFSRQLSNGASLFRLSNGTEHFPLSLYLFSLPLSPSLYLFSPPSLSPSLSVFPLSLCLFFPSLPSISVFPSLSLFCFSPSFFPSLSVFPLSLFSPLSCFSPSLSPPLSVSPLCFSPLSLCFSPLYLFSPLSPFCFYLFFPLSLCFSPPLYLFFPLSLYLFFPLSLYLFFPLSLSVFPSLSICFFPLSLSVFPLSLSVFPSLSVFSPLSLSVFPSLYLFSPLSPVFPLSLSVFPSLSICFPPLSLSVFPPSLSICFSLSLYLFFPPLSISFFFPLSLYLFFPLSLYLFFPLSLYLFFPLSLSVFPSICFPPSLSLFPLSLFFPSLSILFSPFLPLFSPFSLSVFPLSLYLSSLPSLSLSLSLLLSLSPLSPYLSQILSPYLSSFSLLALLPSLFLSLSFSLSPSVSLSLSLSLFLSLSPLSLFFVLSLLLFSLFSSLSLSFLLSPSLSFLLLSPFLGSLTGVGNLTLTPEQEQKITIMEQLYGLCVQGKQCCRRVLTAKKIALVLGRKYEFVITSDEFTILEMLLKVENSVRFHLAKEFLATSTVTDTQLAGFLADAILKSLKICAAELRSPDSNSPTAVEHDLIFNPIGPAGGDSQQFLQLCQDPSRLGDRLLDAVASLASDTNPDVLTVQTQLLILAHRCHTAACNMEGISNVLRAARVLNQCLSQAEEFPLMIQLLTGVGRFNEMTYIFDALKQHHQFELLLRKGMEKEDQLKVAILDYLKRFHANDSDSYTMVAINFTMFREIGQMLEELAQKNLVILKRKPLVNSAEVETTLHKIHQYFSDASESYMKDNILRHAEYCVRQARLVRLQLDLLSSGIHVINLTPEDAVNFIIQHPKFSEALVVSEAYNKTAVWGEALCNRLIIHGDFRYLQDLKAYIRLNPALIIDTIDRYKQLPQKPSQCEGNLKKLLLYCKDLRLQYQIARELGLKDFLSQLETGHNSAYIMDIAASRGSAHFAF
ncbi:SPG11 [Acanthosepion pharaonis]|uniref:SPG11 n=1 Tax=Acanthosepion pharaonis TaxID=158019 RepID=A0A812DSI7_ACAPH|nr:SPG11 [Sepia pharaonis]